VGFPDSAARARDDHGIVPPVTRKEEPKMEKPELDGVLEGMRDLVTVKRVYGKPYEKNGLTVIPAAAVRGGGGGGGGRRGDGESGAGGGLGVVARPSGAWVIRDGVVRWKPAVDVTRIVLAAELVALVAILLRHRLTSPKRG
jgi:uncharacterized spore protein YtfJ